MTDFNLNITDTEVDTSVVTVFDFSIAPNSALGSAVTVRWEIILDGEFPLLPSHFDLTSSVFTTDSNGNVILQGLVSFVQGATDAVTIELPIDFDELGGFVRSFSLSAFEVIDANNETQIGDTRNIILDDSANFMKSAFGGTYSFSASGDNDIVAIGGAASVALNSAGGADIYVVRQDQYGDVSISDSLGSNEVWFEEGVKLVAFDVDETSSFFGTSVNSMALTLSTGAIVTVIQPASSTFQYRLGDGALLGFTDFRSAVGAVLTSTVTSAVYEAQGELPAASNIASSNDVLYLVHSSANSDIYSLGHNLDYRYNGAGGDDTYVITEHQTGHVVIDDPLAQTIVKLGFGVSVDSIVQDITSSFFGTSYNDLTLTLSSGATVVIKNPNSSSKFYQIGDGVLLSREEFFDTIDGATEADPYVVSKGKTPVFNDSTDYTLSANSLSIDETAISKTFGADFSATDAEGNTITYSVSGLTGLSISSAGVVSYSGVALDQDIANPVTSYNITVTATSNGTSITKNAVLNINAVDEAPVFTNTTDYTLGAARLGLNETQTSKTFSANFAATDAEGDTITYSLSSTLTGLSISSTGVVSYSGVALDVDGSNPVTSYDLTVTATSNGKSTAKDAVLVIGSVNEASVFDANVSYSFDVNENTSGVLFTVNAVDPDGSTVYYSLVSSPPDGFSIDSSTGEVSYTGVGLDHETQDEYSLTVRARSGGQNTNQVVTVNILDVNDAPVVSTIVYAQEIATAATAASFAVSSSMFSDEDGDTIYYASSFTVTDDNNTDTSWLTFNASSGEFSVSDQSVAGVYNITVTAMDRDDGTGFSTTGVFTLVIATDVFPEFDSNASYSFDLNEHDTSEDFGSVTATVDVNFLNLTISYALVGIDGEEIPAGFAIDSSTGVISYTGAGYNYESLTDKFVVLRVQATSSTGNTTATQDVTINILDVNDVAVFSSSTPSTLSIDENDTSEAFGTITATDENDDDSAITFALVAAEGASSVPTGFAITPGGVLSYNGAGIDRESLAEDGIVTVRVQALSDGDTSTTDIAVTVNDLDEFDIEFVNGTNLAVAANSLTINENQTSKTFSANLSASDGDATHTVTYSLSTTLTGLSMSSAGVVIYSGVALDQDIANPVTSYSFTVTATANGISITRDALLRVITVNETPVFAEDSYDVNENSSGAIFTVNAVDPEGTTVTYSLVSPPDGFSIDSATGDVSYTGAGLDYETQDEYSLTVRASAGGQNTNQVMTVNISDVNDAPVVSTIVYVQEIENAATAASFTIPSATFSDEDGDTLYYASSFTVTDDNNTDTSWLTFNASSGEFSVSDQSVAGIYNITVTATDRSDGTGFSTTGVFKLYIATDVFPEFDSNASYSFDLNENDTSEDFGSVVAIVDTSFAASISYELVGIDGAEVPAGFAIDSTTGAISYTGSGLNYESSTDKFVVLRVQATSSRGDTTATQDVTINILDIAETPVFTDSTD